MNQDVYIRFIDYQEAFVNVKHEEMFRITEELDLDEKDMRILKNIYKLEADSGD